MNLHTRTSEQKIEDLRAAGSYSSSLFADLLYLILVNQALNQLPFLYDRYQHVLNTRANRVLVQVESAIPLSADALANIESRLGAVLNKAVTLRNDVDPDLVAGLQFRFPEGKVYDFTYRRALSDFKYYLMERN